MYDASPRPALPDADHRRLVRAATRLLGPADAEDAVQDAYVRALEGEQRELNSAQAWLLTVVRNLAIDRLRRRSWMQQWLEETGTADAEQASPSAETDAALAQEASRALRLLAAHLAPEDGAALLLHEVFEVSHAEIAEANGRSEAASRQQLRRALLRLRQARSSADEPAPTEREPSEETVFRLYLQSLQLRDPQVLWAMLRHPPISAVAGMSAMANEATATPHAITSGVVQMGGQLGLVLTLDGVRLCVVPLGVRAEQEADVALFS
ncbi:sigma-70 family RNA polymerase sigma factor [Rhodoferax saidenbachensis]|uniref:RNA polymerase sigma-70 factor (ECF subfamily) n=1 Tax=Rhodoferax saidenbachensis TaxID=1484693 RepID=A0ABU1ZTI5_9BURK|nr:sigma-70 family RNA polymerase sigma factor [Rhodoferax saidenbachensis]MDR7308870.1 RNA polymerase sigma-70 factor (ECF subfamily) [Rhodoferax saidenbachensis]